MSFITSIFCAFILLAIVFFMFIITIKMLSGVLGFLFDSWPMRLVSSGILGFAFVYALALEKMISVDYALPIWIVASIACFFIFTP